MSELGPQPLGSTVTLLFTTSVNGVPTTLSSGVISCYLNNTTEITAGITLNADYDSRFGLNQVVIVATVANGYAAGNCYDVVITTGTLSGVSMIGYVVGSFQLTTSQTNVNYTLNAVARGTVTTGASTTSLPTSAFQIAGAAASGVVASQYVGRVVLFDGNTTTAGLQGASATISASTASNTPTLTVSTLPATPVSGDTFSVI